MDNLSSFISVAMIAIFVQNVIFSKALGTSVVFYASRKKSSIIGLGAGIAYVTIVSCIISYWFDLWLGDGKYYYIFMPLLYVVIISVVYMGSLLLIWRFLPKLFRSIKKYVHLSVFNAAVLGALFLRTAYGGDFFAYLGYSVGVSVGFFIAAFFLNIANERLNSELVPKAFRGMPIMMVYVGIMSLAFYALIGYTTLI